MLTSQQYIHAARRALPQTYVILVVDDAFAAMREHAGQGKDNKKSNQL